MLAPILHLCPFCPRVESPDMLSFDDPLIFAVETSLIEPLTEWYVERLLDIFMAGLATNP